jgi:cation:H+ antiporter
MDILFVAAGLVLLFAGGESLVRGASALAARLGLSPALIGLTVVGFGTSLPELLVSVQAALRGAPDIAMGNVVGSNTANILLIAGVAALLSPIAARTLSMGRDTLWMLAAAVAVLIPAWLGLVSWPLGLALVAGLALYLTLAIRNAENTDETPPGLSPVLTTVTLVLGLAALVGGAHFLVTGSVGLARAFGLSEAFIGLTIVAVGTSLPELATTVVAALRRQSAIAIGNVVGSNIFNVLGILGATALIAPVPVAARFLSFDVPVMIAASVLLVVSLRAQRLGRVWGVGLLAAYAAYVWSAQG